MAKYEVLIKAVTVQGLSYRQVAARYGVSKSLVHKLHHRWLTEGGAAFEPQSRRPHSTPNRTPQIVRDRIVALRDELVADGLDAGADTITEMLAREGVTTSRATVWRILTAAGRVDPATAETTALLVATVRPRTDPTSSGSPTSPTSSSAPGPRSR